MKVKCSSIIILPWLMCKYLQTRRQDKVFHAWWICRVYPKGCGHCFAKVWHCFNFVHLRYVLVLHGEDQKIPAVISYSNVTTLDIDPPIVQVQRFKEQLMGTFAWANLNGNYFGSTYLVLNIAGLVLFFVELISGLVFPTSLY